MYIYTLFGLVDYNGTISVSLKQHMYGEMGGTNAVSSKWEIRANLVTWFPNLNINFNIRYQFNSLCTVRYEVEVELVNSN